MKPFMTNVFLNADYKIWDVSCCILFQSCDWTESENVNFIKISDEKWLFDVTMITELFIAYFCNIKFCFKDLMRKFSFFTDKLFVFKYCFIFIVLGQDTSSDSSKE